MSASFKTNPGGAPPPPAAASASNKFQLVPQQYLLAKTAPGGAMDRVPKSALAPSTPAVQEFKTFANSLEAQVVTNRSAAVFGACALLPQVSMSSHMSTMVAESELAKQQAGYPAHPSVIQYWSECVLKGHQLEAACEAQFLEEKEAEAERAELMLHMSDLVDAVCDADRATGSKDEKEKKDKVFQGGKTLVRVLMKRQTGEGLWDALAQDSFRAASMSMSRGAMGLLSELLPQVANSSGIFSKASSMVEASPSERENARIWIHNLKYNASPKQKKSRKPLVHFLKKIYHDGVIPRHATGATAQWLSHLDDARVLKGSEEDKGRKEAEAAEQAAEKHKEQAAKAAEETKSAAATGPGDSSSSSDTEESSSEDGSDSDSSSVSPSASAARSDASAQKHKKNEQGEDAETGELDSSLLLGLSDAQADAMLASADKAARKTGRKRKAAAAASNNGSSAKRRKMKK